MHFRIIRTEAIPSALRHELEQREHAIFAGSPLSDIQWAGADWMLFVYEGQDWVSSLEIIERTITVGGLPLHVGGISGVMTPPEYRQKGYAAAGVKWAVEFIRDELKAPFALLICGGHLLAYYQSLGWQAVSGSICYQQDGEAYAFSGETHALIYPCTNQPWPGGMIDFCGTPW